MKFKLGWMVCHCAGAGCGHPPRLGEPSQPRRGLNKCKSGARSSGDEKEFVIKRLKMLTLPWEGGNPCREPVLQVTSVRKKTFLRGREQNRAWRSFSEPKLLSMPLEKELEDVCSAFLLLFNQGDTV